MPIEERGVAMEDIPLIATQTHTEKPPAQIYEDDGELIEVWKEDPLLLGRVVPYWHAVSDWSMD